MVIIRNLENTGYKTSWLQISSWRCCVSFSISLSTHLPLSTGALCCLFSWVLCKCVVTLLPARNHWLMFKFPWLTARFTSCRFTSACCGDWKEVWTVGCDVWVDSVMRIYLALRQKPKWIQRTIYRVFDKWMMNLYLSLVTSDTLFTFFETNES